MPPNNASDVCPTCPQVLPFMRRTFGFIPQTKNTHQNEENKSTGGTFHAGNDNSSSNSNLQIVAASPAYRGWGQSPSCFALASQSFSYGARFGLIFGIGEGVLRLMNFGVNQQTLVASATGAVMSAFRTGLFLSTYRFMYCQLYPELRNRHSTAALAGASTGALFSLPAAYVTRDFRQVGMNGLFTGVMAVLFEALFHA